MPSHSMFVLLIFVPVAAEAHAVFEQGATPQLLQKSGAGEGLAWKDGLGLISSGEGNINLRDETGKQSVYRKGAGSNGLLFDHEGRLLICEPVRRCVSRLEHDGTLKILADRYDGKRFNQPNDITIDSKGRIYFSDPCYGDRSQMEMTDAQGKSVEGVYRIDPDGKITRVITQEANRPNGLMVSSGDRYLFVADNNNDTEGGARKLWRFELASDGSIVPGTRLLLHDWGKTRGPDGMKRDSKGRLFVAGGLNRPNPPFEVQDKATAGVYVFSESGKLLDFVAVPHDEVTNCAFGGADRKTLFITSGGTLWSIRVRDSGVIGGERPR